MRSFLAWLLLVSVAFAGTPTQYYVDTVGGNNGDAGTSFANGWLTLKYAIETGIPGIGRDATNGDQINIYAPVGTPDNYSSGDPAIALSSYATDASVTAPLIIRGVGSDGSTPAIAYITCSGRYLVNDTTFDYSRWINISVVGGSATGLFEIDRNSMVLGCLFDNTAGGIPVRVDGITSHVDFCDIQGASGSVYLLDVISGYAIGNYVHELTNSCRGIVNAGNAIGNIVHLNSTTASGHGINTATAAAFIHGNTILNDAAGTVAGINSTSANAVITNNYIEGFSGTGGTAVTAAASNTLVVATNRYYACETGFTLGDVDYSSDNSVTTASGVANRATADYTPTVELKEIGLPLTIGGETTFINVGAIQTEGGGMAIDPIILP